MTANIVAPVTTPPDYQASQVPGIQQPAQAEIGPISYPSDGYPAQAAPAAQQPPTANPAAGEFWDHPTEGDKIFAASENFLAAQEKAEEMQLRQMTGHSVLLEFRRPRDVLRKVVPQPYAFDDVPPLLGWVAQQYAQAMGHDQSGIIVACVTAAASVIDDRYRLTVRPETNWHVSARQWAFLCGGSSSGKSPSMRAATEPVKGIHGDLHRRWSLANERKPRDEQAPAPAVYTSDTTIAALSERLQGNPRGLLMLTEEFASWIGGIDSGNRGEAAKNRGDWLQLRDGGPHQIDRVERGSVYVPNWGVSVLAACTPGGLASQMKHMPEDGLIQRFVPCILGAPNIEASGDARQALTTWEQWLKWAYNFTTRETQSCICLRADARVLFDAEVKSIRELVVATEEFSPAYASHLGKTSGDACGGRPSVPRLWDHKRRGTR
ncbi:DUF3987 domain-containing protein [Cupriavidus basilensis]